MSRLVSDIAEALMDAGVDPDKHDPYRYAHAALQVISAAGLTQDWRPINTAPKDGTIVWVGAPYSLCVAYWHGKDEMCWRNWYRGCRYHQHHLGVDNFLPEPIWFTPTHWMPVPSVRDLKAEGHASVPATEGSHPQ